MIFDSVSSTKTSAKPTELCRGGESIEPRVIFTTPCQLQQLVTSNVPLACQRKSKCYRNTLKTDDAHGQLTLLEPQSRFGDKPLKFQVVCPHNGTAVLKGLHPFICLKPFLRSYCFLCLHLFVCLNPLLCLNHFLCLNHLRVFGAWRWAASSKRD